MFMKLDAGNIDPKYWDAHDSTYDLKDDLVMFEEEAAEMIQAASKYNRSLGIGYLTPVDPKDARQHFIEEVSDVLSVLNTILHDLEMQGAITPGEFWEAASTMATYKQKRFVERQEDAEHSAEIAEAAQSSVIQAFSDAGDPVDEDEPIAAAQSSDGYPDPYYTDARYSSYEPRDEDEPMASAQSAEGYESHTTSWDSAPNPIFDKPWGGDVGWDDEDEW